MHLAHDSDQRPKPFDERLQPILHPVTEFDLQELLRKLWRRKWLIAGTVTTVVILVAIILTQLTPRYTAASQIEISPPQANIVDFEAVLAGLPADSETIETEIQIVRSRNLIAKLVQRLDLNRNPEFNASLRPPSMLAEKLDEIRTYLSQQGLPFISSTPDEHTLSDTDRAEAEDAQVLDAVLDRISVAPVGLSRIISIEFESENPKIAASVVNTLADLYIVAQLEAKFEATKRANDWLNDRVAELRAEVMDAEQAVEEFREEHGLLRGQRDATLASEQVSELSAQYIQERTKLAEAEARLRQVERLVNSPNGIESASEVLASDLIQNLRQQEAQLETQTAQLSAELGDRHPRMINARAQLRDIREKIRLEVNKIVEGLRNEVAVARARAASLRGELDTLKQEVAAVDSYQVRLRALEREATAARTLLETLLARSKETASQQTFQQADATVVSYGPIPKTPSYPQKRLILAGAFVFAFPLGVLLVFLIEQLDLGFRSTEQVERAMGATPLGLVPALKGVGTLLAKPERYILEKPGSAYGESIRRLYTMLQLSRSEKPLRTIMLTSALPKEGKTTIVISLARMLASVGRKVIIVDCDLRRPSVHDSFGLPSKPGLVDCLSRDVSLDDAIQEDRHSGAHLLAAGASAKHPASLLSSDSMKDVLDVLAQRYDAILIDSSPVLAVSDTLILSRIVDATVFVVRWADTRRETAINGLRQILEARGFVAGVLLSMVDVKAHAQYGFGDSGSYTGKIKKYYTG